MFALLLTFRRHSQPIGTLLDTSGSSGWSGGIAWVLGVTNSMYPFACSDAAIHIAEEMINPAKRLLQVAFVILGVGFATAFPLILLMMLSITDKDAVVQSPLPYAEAFYQMTGNKALTIFMTIWVTFILFSALIGQWIVVGRLAWAFARDGGLPWSSFFAYISPRFGFPVRTTLVALIFCCAYGLLYLVSTTAFNSIITSTVLLLNITYCAPQLILALRGRRETLPEHPVDFGWFGTFCNHLSPVLVLVLAVLVCFPPERPVTASNSNYNPVVLVTCCAAILMVWRFLGKNFEGPKINWEVLRNMKIT